MFRIAPDGTETVLHAFQAGSDGWQPSAGLIADGAGNFYGITAGGGGGNCQLGCGTVFKITPAGTETILYAFQGGTDGVAPVGPLLMDGSGNLYGTTGAGGGCTIATTGCGTVFKLAPDGTESVLYAFQGGMDGWGPQSGVITDKAGNLYGTTIWGGVTSACHAVSGNGCGVVFEVTPAGAEKVLYAFRGQGGRYPEAGLLFGKHGELYGTATQGGDNRSNCAVPKVQKGCGVVFSVKD